MMDVVKSNGKINLSLRLSAVYASLFCYVGIYLPFWAIWLQSKGMSPTEISLLLAFPQVLKVVISPLVMQYVDKKGALKLVFTAFLALTSIIWFFYFYAEGFFYILIVSIGVNIFLPNSMPMMEALTLRETKKHKLNYGIIRSAGSIAFIIISVAFGKYLETHDIDAVPLFAFCAIVAGFVFALFLPRDPKKTKASNDNITAKSPLLDLMSNGNFLIFISVSTLLHMSHGFFYTIGSIQWQDIGFDKGTIGYLWAVGVVAEIIVFLFGSRFMEKIRPMHMFMVIALVGVVRWIIMAEVTNLSVLYAAQILHGFTFGATHLASMYFISSRVPSKYSATAQGLYSALPMGIGTGITMFASGYLYNSYGAGAYYVMAFCCFFAFFLSLKLRRLTN